MTDMVEVPSGLLDALREALPPGDEHFLTRMYGDLGPAARAVVDAAEPETMRIRSVSIVDEKDAFSPDCRIEVATVPRVARSLSDLKPGQVVATICADGSAGECITFSAYARKPYREFIAGGGTVVILSEAPEPDPPPVTIPRDLYDRLREKVEAFDGPRSPGVSAVWGLGHAAIDAARAVVAAAREGQHE